MIDPEQDATRVSIFAAMAAMLVVSLSVPEAFGDLGLTFAIGYAVVRTVHIVLFVLASPDDADLRASVLSLAASTAVGTSLLVGASFLDGAAQGALWALAIVLDLGGRTGAFHNARIGISGTAGRMPLVLNGDENGQGMYYSGGLYLAVAFGIGAREQQSAQ